ncbi:lipopolysaccharide biosynthesis protein [Agromyces sp. NPDC056523]|uniref:lipopolysaccharide biosynthesis protein n=1 Tax=Agromyces sp. NPDC056523 TaxID=3345850 RepID=UPI00366B492C
MRRGVIARALGGYGLSVVLSGIVSLLVIPAVIIAAGTESWATIAVAQAVAGFAFVLAVYGWGVVGPTEVASRPVEERGSYFADSVLSRVWLSIVVVPVAVVVAIAITPQQALLAALTTISGILVALGAGWFYVGERSPIRFLLLDTAPRLIGTLAGAAAVIATRDAVWFAALQLAGVAISALICTVDILRRYRGWHPTLSPVRAVRNLRGQGHTVAMSATSSVYVNVPIVLVELFVPAATAVYALAERMVRLALYATRPVVQVAQGWVPHPEPDVLVARARRVTAIALLLGALGGLAYALLSPWAGGILSGGELTIDWDLAIPMGVNLAAILASQLTGFACLTALGMSRVLSTSTIAGAVVGTALMIPLLLLIGAPGVAWGLAAAELAVLGVQLWKLVPRLRPAVAVGS